MSTITRPRNRVKVSTLPLDAKLTLAIRGTSYSVTPIPPGPDNSRAWRLAKLGGKNEVYDLARTTEGLVVCDCPSYVATHEGTSSACKHGLSLIQVGLLDPVKYTAAKPFVRLPDEFDEPAEVVPQISAEPLPPAADSRVDEPDAPSAPTPFDRDFHHSQSAVAEGRALWLEHRDLFASEPLPAKAPCCPSDEPAPCGACVEPFPTDEPPDEPLKADETFVAWIARQADAYDQMRTPRAVWLAGQLARLAERARFLEADGPGDFQDKAATLELLDDSDHDNCNIDADAWRDEVEYAW
jgi:hypothetical protein